MAGTLIYECGDATYTKHFAQDAQGQWHYRIANGAGHFSKWLACENKPDYAWYSPQAGRANIKAKE